MSGDGDATPRALSLKFKFVADEESVKQVEPIDAGANEGGKPNKYEKRR
jgi:hypothetical protein